MAARLALAHDDFCHGKSIKSGIIIFGERWIAKNAGVGNRSGRVRYDRSQPQKRCRGCLPGEAAYHEGDRRRRRRSVLAASAYLARLNTVSIGPPLEVVLVYFSSSAVSEVITRF